MKVAIVHYWLVNMRGGERVVESLLRIFPDADIYTHVVDQSAISQPLAKRIAGTTFVGKLPFAARAYQSYLPFMPMALEQLDLRGYDLVISSESGPAKGVIVDPGAVHICYCHSPMRYVWDMYHDYRERAGWLKRIVMPLLIHYMRNWDAISSMRVAHYVANSKFVASRIQQYYRREASVIHPPVAVDEFELAESKEDYYLFVGELVSYKRPDLAVEAFAKSGRTLKIVGSGELLSSLSSVASENIQLLGKVEFSELKGLYSKARALIFPGTEDFGMVPVEAMASGTPVIAYGKGGALETVCDGISGLLFSEQTSKSLNEAVSRFEEIEATFNGEELRRYARQFDESSFVSHMSDYILQKVGESR